jgi:hypothetical protein
MPFITVAPGSELVGCVKHLIPSVRSSGNV